MISSSLHHCGVGCLAWLRVWSNSRGEKQHLVAEDRHSCIERSSSADAIATKLDAHEAALSAAVNHSKSASEERKTKLMWFVATSCRWCVRRRKAPDMLAESSLTAECSVEKRALLSLQAELGRTDLAAVSDVLVPGEALQSCLLRFLRARNFDVGRAAAMLRKDLDWRKSVNPKLLMTRRPEEVTGCHAELLQKYGSNTTHQGFDRQGRPVVFKNFGQYRIQKLLHDSSVEKLKLLHIAENENAMHLCGAQSVKLGQEITEVVYIIEAAGWDPMNLLSLSALSQAQFMATVDQDHYPERLATVIVINAPSVVYRFWQVIMKFVDVKTRNKVQIYAKREQWIPVLEKLMETSQLAPEYRRSAYPQLDPPDCVSFKH